MIQSLYNELKRRNVFKVAIAYLVVSWLILQVTGTVVPIIQAPNWVSKVVLIFLMAGFPIALILAWAFELTPDGIKKESEINRENSIVKNTSRKIDYLIITTLIFIIGGMVAERVFWDDEKEQSIENTQKASGTSIAVMPFVDMSPQKDQEYFSDGISEEILNVLAKIPGLQITSRSSAFSFKGSHTDLPTIAKKLGVANILEGSVRKAGTKIRITAQLIDAQTDKHLWSETYDRELTDIFKVQDEISADIVGALKETLGISIKKTKALSEAIDPVAYDWYLKGLQQHKENTFESLQASVESYKKALDLAPEFTLAKIHLAESLNTQFRTGSKTAALSRDIARKLIEQVLQQDPNNSQALYQHSNIAADRASREEALEKAYKLDPNNGPILVSYALMKAASISEIERINLFNRAIKLDPLNAQVPYFIGRYFLFAQGNVEKAKYYYKQSIEKNPKNGTYTFLLGSLYGGYDGNLVKALEYFKLSSKQDENDPDALIFQSRSFLSLGDAEKALKYADKAIALNPNSADANLSKITAFIYQGKSQQALKLANAIVTNPKMFYRKSRQSKINLMKLGVYLYLVQKNYDAAKTFIEKTIPASKTIDKLIMATSNTREENYALSLMSVIYKAEGKLEKSQQISDKLVSGFRKFEKSNPFNFNAQLYLFKAEAEATRLKNDKVVDYLTEVIDKGRILNWRAEILYNPLFLNLHQNQQYIDLIKRIEDEMARQRKIVEETQYKRESKDNN